jgi:biotin-dependent carboxylase-like uncharacterized protein
MLEILQAGPLTLVQDLGRPGLRHLGLGAGGAFDAPALQRANALVGNPPGAAALEFPAGPLRLRCASRELWVALAGAEFAARIGRQAQPPGLRWRLPAGEELRLDGPISGLHGVLAVDGGIALPPQLGSLSTQLRAGIGGLQGRALRGGDRLPLGPARALKGRLGLRPPSRPARLRVLIGPEFDELDAASRRAFWQAEWRVAPQSDRMGLRLAGPPLRRSGAELLSHAVLPGLIQLPPGGQPIVLGVDAQTTGGYPRLAQLIEADLCYLAQLRPGEALGFARVEIDEARELLDAQQRELANLRRWLDHAQD